MDLIPRDYSLTRMAGTLGLTPDRLKLDERLPDNLPLPAGGNRNHTFFHATLALARRLSYTARELIRALAGSGGHRVIVGTPEQIADHMQLWMDEGACDGFNIMPAYFHDEFDLFVDQVVPILQRRGIYRTEYEGTTLRDHLGLPTPRRP